MIDSRSGRAPPPNKSRLRGASRGALSRGEIISAAAAAAPLRRRGAGRLVARATHLNRNPINEARRRRRGWISRQLAPRYNQSERSRRRWRRDYLAESCACGHLLGRATRPADQQEEAAHTREREITKWRKLVARANTNHQLQRKLAAAANVARRLFAVLFIERTRRVARQSGQSAGRLGGSHIDRTVRRAAEICSRAFRRKRALRRLEPPPPPPSAFGRTSGAQNQLESAGRNINDNATWAFKSRLLFAMARGPILLRIRVTRSIARLATESTRARLGRAART